MVELISRYSKYMSLNKKEGLILLAQWSLAAFLAYNSSSWDANPVIAKISILSTMVLLTVQRINVMYRKLNADK